MVRHDATDRYSNQYVRAHARSSLSVLRAPAVAVRAAVLSGRVVERSAHGRVVARDRHGVAEVIELAQDLMKKSPEVLRSTKETIKTVRMMSIEESYEFIQAKSEQLRFRDLENTRSRGMGEFLDQISPRSLTKRQ